MAPLDGGSQSRRVHEALGHHRIRICHQHLFTMKDLYKIHFNAQAGVEPRSTMASVQMLIEPPFCEEIPPAPRWKRVLQSIAIGFAMAGVVAVFGGLVTILILGYQSTDPGTFWMAVLIGIAAFLITSR